jgi:glutaminase
VEEKTTNEVSSEAANVQARKNLKQVQKLYAPNSAGQWPAAGLVNFIEVQGLRLDDPRIKRQVEVIRGWDYLNEDRATALFNHNLIKRLLRRDLAIKDFPEFADRFKSIFHEVSKCKEGNVATYIPQLANQNPNLWGAAVCSVDGQRYAIGDHIEPFCVQSTSKPITYCVAMELNGESKVHQHVGREPSGRNFNDRCLMQQGEGKRAIPHNPYINAGAIMTASLTKMEVSEWDRFNYMMGIWQMLCGGKKPSFQNDTFMGERATASRNFCLAYMMEEENAFPFGTNLEKTLEAYFTWCSIEINCEDMAMLAATLANGGICPTTSERIFTHEVVTKCLSLMMSCGMYDFSGEFAFNMGFPAKSGVSGIMCIVVPGVCGLATFSPRLDNLGNSERGIQFCRNLSQNFPYHLFSQTRSEELVDPKLHPFSKQILDNLRGAKGNGDVSPRKSNNKRASNSGWDKEDKEDKDLHINFDNEFSSLWWSAARGDEQRIRQLAVRAIDVNNADYDNRSALHLAASEGHDGMVRLLLAINADMDAKDLHGNTPIMDAIREHRHAATRTLQLASRNIQLLEDQAKEEDSMPDLFKYFTGLSVNAMDGGLECVQHRVLVETLDSYGFACDEDPRFAFLDDLPDPFTKKELEDVARTHPLLVRTLCGELVVPNFVHFCDVFEELFSNMLLKQEVIADYDDTLSVATVDGQRLHLGKSNQCICAGDLVALALFAVGIELLGHEALIEFVGHEPSGTDSRASVLNAEKLPYNPFMWNGMLAICSLLEERIGDAFAVTSSVWAKLCSLSGHNDDFPTQCDEAWLSDDIRRNSHRVNVLIYTSLDLGKFPKNTQPEIVMDIFFRLRAITTSSEQLGRICSVFANGGQHPMTGRRIFQPETVKCVLSMMYSAGCNSQSGEFSFSVGVPAKSSTLGLIVVVIPNVMGLCVYSPNVNHHRVSIGGLDFCTELGDKFSFHVLSGTSTSSAKEDPSLYHFQTDMELCNDLLFACETGDMMTLSALHQLGFSLDYADYDGRSAAHVAATNGHAATLKYLYKKGANFKATDRWGSKPRDDAYREGHQECIAFLESVWVDDDEASACSGGVSAMGDGESTTARPGPGAMPKRVERTAAPVAAKIGPNTMRRSHDEPEEEEDDGLNVFNRHLSVVVQ